jgi:hypothetical protein
MNKINFKTNKMETLQNIWNFISDFYNQNALLIWVCIGISANILLFLQIWLKLLARDGVKKAEKEIERLKEIISTYNSKFVDIESNNLPKRNIKTGRFEKRL